MIPNILDSKMIGIEKCETTTTMMMINEVNTMTPRQNDLVVKKHQKTKVKNDSNEDLLKFIYLTSTNGAG